MKFADHFDINFVQIKLIPGYHKFCHHMFQKYVFQKFCPNKLKLISKCSVGLTDHFDINFVSIRAFPGGNFLPSITPCRMGISLR